MFPRILVVIPLLMSPTGDVLGEQQEVASAVGEAATRSRVSWSALRAEIEKSFCMEDYELPDGNTAYGPIAGFRNLCGGGVPEEGISMAVENAMEEIRPVLAGIEPEGLDAAMAEGLTLDDRTHLLRETYFGSQDFLRLLMPHLISALDVAGFVCEGCPQPEVRAQRRIGWHELAPYVAAHAWPDRVKTVLGPDGQPVERQGYGMHFCAGINGISEMKEPDPLLTRAAFVGMFHSMQAKEIARGHFSGILKAEAFRALTDDDARTTYLRRRLPEELIADPGLRAAVCPTLALYATDLGLTVDECEAAAQPDEDGK